MLQVKEYDGLIDLSHSFFGSLCIHITTKAQSVLLRAFTAYLISIKSDAYFFPRHAAMVRRTRSAVVTLRRYSSTSALPISTSGLE